MFKFLKNLKCSLGQFISLNFAMTFLEDAAFLYEFSIRAIENIVNIQVIYLACSPKIRLPHCLEAWSLEFCLIVSIWYFLILFFQLSFKDIEFQITSEHRLTLCRCREKWMISPWCKLGGSELNNIFHCIKHSYTGYMKNIFTYLIARVNYPSHIMCQNKG